MVECLVSMQEGLEGSPRAIFFVLLNVLFLLYGCIDIKFCIHKFKPCWHTIQVMVKENECKPQ